MFNFSVAEKFILSYKFVIIFYFVGSRNIPFILLQKTFLHSSIWFFLEPSSLDHVVSWHLQSKSCGYLWTLSDHWGNFWDSCTDCMLHLSSNIYCSYFEMCSAGCLLYAFKFSDIYAIPYKHYELQYFMRKFFCPTFMDFSCFSVFIILL